MACLCHECYKSDNVIYVYILAFLFLLLHLRMIIVIAQVLLYNIRYIKIF